MPTPTDPADLAPPPDERPMLQPGEFIVTREAAQRVGALTLKRLNGDTGWTYDLYDPAAFRSRALVGSEFPVRLVIDGVTWVPSVIDEKARHVTYRRES